MPPSPSGSFIPKRNTGSRPKGVHRYHFFILPIISYTMFIAAPLASAALFIYQIRVDSQFKTAVAALELQIKDFNDVDLTRVIEFDDRLKLSKQLVSSHVSLISLLAILENATADTVRFSNLSITRKDEKTLLAKGTLVTSALDGALFQRATYSTATQIAQAKLSGITLVSSAAATAASAASAASAAATKTDINVATKSAVTLSAEFTFAADKILYAPLGVPSGSSAGTKAVSPAVTPVTSTTPPPSPTAPPANVITP